MQQRTILRRIFDRISGEDARRFAKALAVATNDAVNDHRVLTARVSGLTDQVRILARAAELKDSVPPPAPADGSATTSRRRAKFTVFSNPRSGSTWLETMLGLLPDVHVDYELKWGVNYRVPKVCVVLDENSRSVSEVLEDMETDAPVTGSKFVFDAHGLTLLDFQSLSRRIGPDVRVIHLTRCYREVFLSIARGYYHAAARIERIGERLRQAISGADVSRAEARAPQPVPPAACFRQLAVLLDNDLYVRSLREAGVSYLQISYGEVDERFADIVRFAGSEAPTAVIADVLARPAVTKLPEFTGDSVIANLAELEPLFDAFEVLRQSLVVDTNGPTKS